MKNILLFVCDSLRADYVTPEITPNLWKYLEKGWNYTQCIAGNSCTDLSLPVMLSADRSYKPEDSIVSDLRSKGYKSILLHSNPKVHQFKEGWDDVIDFHNESAKQKKKLRRLIRKFGTKQILDQVSKITNLEDQMDYLPYTRAFEKLEYITKNITSAPYFKWVHLMDPHLPYYPMGSQLNHQELVYLNDRHVDAVHKRIKPKKGEVSTWKRLYQTEINEMDGYIGEYLKSVDMEKTIVIITSDHGEEFGEHGDYSHPGDKFIPELVHVPMIILGQDQGSTEKIFSHYGLRGLVNKLAESE